MHISPHYLVASNTFPTHFQHSWVECSFSWVFYYCIFFFAGEKSATSEDTNSSLVADICLSLP